MPEDRRGFPDPERVAKVRAFRRKLRRTHMAFYAPIGVPNALQMAALDPLLRGHDLLITAPTATGKTEAALAPLVERLLAREAGRGEEERLALLYLAPTKALCREMGERLGGNLSLFGRKVRVRTGDSPRPPVPVPFALVTTVESFDSLLARAREVLGTIQAVVIDEIHAVHGNSRGDQLQVLLHRLDRLCPTPAQRVALSATVGDPEEVRARYLHGGEMITGGGRRAIRLRCVRDQEELIAAMREDRLRRVLAFCRTRRQVEGWAASLADDLGTDRVMVHHAGLSAKVRHRVEEAMRTLPAWICVATSTLEVGIDVGSIEAVALLTQPERPSDFQQRIGRASRRDAVIQVLALADTDEQRRSYEHLVLLADRGEVEVREIRRDPGVIVQQAFSAAFARPSGVDEADLLDDLSAIGARADVRKILDHLVAEGNLRRRQGRLLASTAVMDLGVRGVVHANLPDRSEEAQVVSTLTGEIVGQGLVPQRPGAIFALGGRRWKVRKHEPGKVLADPAPRSVEDEAGPGRSDGPSPWLPYLPLAYREGYPPAQILAEDQPLPPGPAAGS